MITLQDILDCKPCYSRGLIKQLAAGATSCTPRELLTRTDVPRCDRIWLGCALLARREWRRLVEFAEDCVFSARVSAADGDDVYVTNATNATTAATAVYARCPIRAATAAVHAADCAFFAAFGGYRDERERQIRDLIRHLDAAVAKSRGAGGVG